MTSHAPTALNTDPARVAENNTGRIIGVSAVFYGLALLFVTARMYTRIFLVRAFGRDDVVMIGAALGSMAGLICFVIQGYHGLGHHSDTITPADKQIMSQVAFFQSIISHIGALALLKISIALSLLRLTANRWYTCSLWTLIVFVCMYSFMAWMTFFFQCRPMAGYWDKTIEPKPRCYSMALFVDFALFNTGWVPFPRYHDVIMGLTQIACNIFTDVCFATLPIPIIWVLQLKLKTRIYLVAILSLGYFAVAMGVVKAVYQIAYASDTDKSFQQAVNFWGYLQINLGIIAACCPPLKPLVGRVLSLPTTSRIGYSSSNAYETQRRRTSGLPGINQRRGYVKTESPIGVFEMHDQELTGSSNTFYTSVQGNDHGKTFYHADYTGDVSRGEEMITHGRGNENKGIVLTREVSVR